MKPGILVHGGAGRVFSDETASTGAAGCAAAARAGYELLHGGGSAIDAVVEAARILEDDPNYNAGTGAALNVGGEIEHDAMLMDGATLRAGGVAALKGFKNPILVSRKIMEEAPHILLGSEGAAVWAEENGFSRVDMKELVDAKVYARWEKEKSAGWPRKPGTVGAVAIDSHGHVAASTSTGGISGKLVGRIGDTPLLGCGTYADDKAGAASATGFGEDIIRVVMAKFATDRMASGQTAAAAAEQAVEELERVRGIGGIILVDKAGRLGWAFNTDRMSRAWIDGDGHEGSGFGL